MCPPTLKKSGVASLRLRLDSVEAPSVAPYALTEGERPLITSRRSRFVAGDGGRGALMSHHSLGRKVVSHATSFSGAMLGCHWWSLLLMGPTIFPCRVWYEKMAALCSQLLIPSRRAEPNFWNANLPKLEKNLNILSRRKLVVFITGEDLKEMVRERLGSIFVLA